MRKITIAIVLLLAVTMLSAPVQGSFPDVDEDHWAYEAVAELQAVGVVEGYPDGEYKGQRGMTRYEMAMIIARALDNINAELAAVESDLRYLQDEVDELAAGLTAAQVQDVTAIVEAMIADAMPELPDELTEAQAQQVQNMLAALREEFREELDMLGAELGAMEYVLEYIVREEQAAMQATIEDLESRIEALEHPPFIFRGEYSVDFRHVDLVDGQVYTDTATDYFYVDEWPSQLIIGDEVVNFDSADEYAAFVRDWLVAEGEEDNPLAFNAEVPSQYNIKESITVDRYLAGWTGKYDYPAPVKTTGFTQTLGLGFDIYTELFDASIDISIDDDTFDLTDSLLEISATNWDASFSMVNPVSQRDFAVDSEVIKGVTFNYHPFGIETFFGEYTDTVGLTDVETDFIWDDEEEEWVYETVAIEDDFYLLGLSTSHEIAGITIGGSYAMRSDQYDFMADGNVAVFGADLGVDVGDFGLDVDFGYSYPFDEDVGGAVEGDFAAGMLVRANALAELEGIADITGNVRFRDENFSPLYPDDSVFTVGAVGFDEFDDGIGPDALAFGLRADQDLFDFLTAGYVEFNTYTWPDDNMDWNVLVGGGIPLFFDGLEATASFERIHRAGIGVDIDEILAGLSYERAPLTLNADAEVNMRSDEDEIWTIFGGDAAFEVIDNVSLNAHAEMADNLSYDPNSDQLTFGGGLAVTDMELLTNLLLRAYVDYTMYNATIVGEDASGSELGAGGGVTYARDRLTLSNDLSFTMKEGDYDFDGTSDPDVLYDGSKIENVFGVDYVIVEDISFVADYTETMFNFAEGAIEFDCSDWQTREINAGISISF